MLPFIKRRSLLKSEAVQFLKECAGGENLCRKTDQYVRGEASVIRSCATEKYKNPCYKTVLEEYNTLSCTCETEGCNHATASLASLATIALMALLAVAFQ